MSRPRTVAALAVATGLLVTACGGVTNDAAAPAATGEAGTVSTDGCTDPDAATAVIDDAVKVGWTVPLSGPYAGVWQQITDAFAARMALYNEQGGAGGVDVDFFTTDSKLDPEIAKALNNEMIQKDGADIVSSTGTGQVATMIDDAAAACVPFIAATSASGTYRDAATYPWATLYLPSVQLETSAIVAAIEREFPDGATAAVAISPSESGTVYADAFKASAQGTSVEVVEEASLTDPNAAASTLKASGADVLFVASAAQECLAMTTAISRIGWAPQVYQNSTCADRSLYEPAGAAADGQRVFKYEVVPSLPEFAGTPAVEQYLADAASQGLADPMSNWSVTGWTIGEVYADLLTAAAESDDGLTRLSIMEAARAQDFHPATFIEGIDFDTATGGVTGMQPFAWDAETAQFVLDGDPVIVN
ncbi:ABC transporter substrate-binding protein [Modestobacter sp. I12A-02628]|uniref:ABC transporter substrate-binding protein n=1 Tax=Goekera deserti TaxID=2497753 RepID=A0A7K3WFZ2_9ACTN|nr:ABC transporter substrate-binding protein [Goekera deserti]MPQ96500.1 ABC transporter substrate-binding protein [Goekera deserti]NDI47185.1 ABC transporter substrate-binding protein [Goekera deserti]NEL55415.1 ABC transporter substrate-binding protein [Goekera deserti]